MKKPMSSALPLAGAVVLIVAWPAPAVLIDDFSAALGGWPVVQNTIGSGTVPEIVGAPVFGGVRETFIAATSLDLVGVDAVQVGVFPVAGIFDYASSAGADGTASLTYDGGNGLGGVDFSADVFLQIDFNRFDLANGLAMPVTVTFRDTLAASASLTKTLTSAGAQSVLFPFADFTNIGGLNLASIDSLVIAFDPGLGTDFRLDQIHTEVPEPATLTLLALAAGMVSRRRRP